MGKVLGLDRLKKRCKALAVEVADAVERGVKAGCEDVAEEARLLAPVESGEMRDGIHVERSAHKRGAAAEWRVVVDVEDGGEADDYYPPYVEFGTETSAPRPFMTPAFEKKKFSVRRRIAAEARRALRRDDDWARRR